MVNSLMWFSHELIISSNSILLSSTAFWQLGRNFQTYFSASVRKNKHRECSWDSIETWMNDLQIGRIKSISEPFSPFCIAAKVIYTKYSKHWLYTVAHTIECVCSKINNSWFNPWFSFYISSLCPAPYIEWYIC